MESRWLKSVEGGFENEMFSHLNRIRQEQDEYISTPYEVEEGVVECVKCKSKKVYSVSVQTRSADEPMSTRATCMNCKYKWTQNC